jgi:hypothetical protein
MSPTRRYAEELRAIGQALQKEGVTAFELHAVPAGYFIKNLTEPPFSLRNWLRELFNRRAESATFGFQLGDLEALSEAGRARRSSDGQITNFRELSNVLRTIGAYVDSKHGELIDLQKTAISVSLAYRDKLGNEQREDRTLSSFYPIFRENFTARAVPPREDRS